MPTSSATVSRAKRRSRRASQRVGGRATFPDIYFVKRIDNSRLRREIDPEKRRECFCLLALAVLVFLFGLLFARQHFQCVRLGYQVEQLKAQRAKLEQWNHQFRLQQAYLADPGRIDALARRELGMASPEAQQIIRVAPAASRPTSTPEYARNLSALGEIPREP